MANPARAATLDNRGELSTSCPPAGELESQITSKQEVQVGALARAGHPAAARADPDRWRRG